MAYPNIDLLSRGAIDQEIRRLMDWAHQRLSADYIAFLRTSDGADTRTDLPEYFRFWGAREVIDYNKGYEIDRHLPGMIGIGDDGGPSMFLLCVDTGAVHRYPFSLDPIYGQQVARSFADLLSYIARLQPQT